MKKTLALISMALLIVQLAIAQNRTIIGKVTDETGQPLEGASLIIKGTTTSAIANTQGNFSIAAKTGDILVISAVNFDVKEVRIGSEDVVNLSLFRHSKMIEGVVVTANAIKRQQKSLGYSATMIGNAELTQGKNHSILNALQAKIAGVNITSTANAPGSSSRIVLRGGSSLTGNNQALLVVDGIPIDNSSIIGGGSSLTSVDFGNRGNDINPDDIESITVLKGPGAAALYGSRASNGALIITTKSGRNNLKKHEVTFSTGITFSNILKLPEFQNDYGQGYNNSIFDPKENWNWGPMFDGVVRPWGQEVNGVAQQRPYSAVENNVRDFFETGIAFNNNISFSGSNEKSSYFLSFNTLNADGIIPTNRDNYDKYSLRFNGASQLTNKISSTIAVNYIRINSDVVGGGFGGGSVYRSVNETPRNIPLTDLQDLTNPYNSMGGIFDASGNELYGYYGAYTVNPYFQVHNYHNKNNIDRILGNFSISYKPFNWLDITERLGADVYADRRNELSPKYNLLPADNTSGNYSAFNTQSSGGRYYEANYNSSDITHDLMITVRQALSKDFNASLLVGHNIRMHTFNQLEAQTNATGGLVIPGVYNLNNSNGPIASANFQSQRRLVGLYADFNFAYKDFLFLGFTARNDWSSTLPIQNNSFFYPSINGAFVFTELLGNASTNKWLSYGKLRASWAQVGNDAQPYQLDSYFDKTVINGDGSPTTGLTVFPLGSVPGYTLGNQIGSLNLKPEITTAFEVGTELAFLKNRFIVDFSYYENKSKDQILAIPISNTTGFTSRIANIGLVENKGVELGIRATPVKTSYGLTWEVYGTYTQNRNKVSGLDVDRIVFDGFLGMAVGAANGNSYGQLFARDFLRDEAGRVIINPGNGEPLLTSSAVSLGSYNPDYIASLGTNLNYKGWNLGILFDTKQGGKFYSHTKYTLDFTGASVETIQGNREGYIFPNSVYIDGSGKSVVNTEYQFFPQNYYTSFIEGRYVIDASYIKLREASLTYSFPNRMLTRTPFGSASISVYGNNLWIKTASENKYVDPEINSAGAGNTQGFDFTAQPSVRNYGVNFKVTF